MTIRRCASLLKWITLAVCCLCLESPVQADLLAGWRKTNSSHGAIAPYGATTNHVKMSAQMTWTNFYKYNDNSWFYIEPFHTGVLANGVSAALTNYPPYQKPFTQYIEFCFTVDPGYKIKFTNMLLRGQNDERRLWFQLRSEADNYSQDLIIGNNNHSTGQWTNRNYLTTTNAFRDYTNALSFMDVTNRPVRLRLYGVAARSAWVYWYMTNLTASAYAGNCMIAFEGEVRRAIDVLPSSGPLVGGNTVVLTNAVDPIIGNGTDITNVQVGALSITNFLGQGTNWVSWVAPPGDSPGAKDIVVCSASTGNTIIASGYTYNPTGVITHLSPVTGPVTGGFPVAIVGSNLCAGDVTNVTWGAGSVAVVSQSSTQVVVTAPAGVGTVNIRVDSTSFGESWKSGAFTYSGPGLQVRGTNGVVIVSGEAASLDKGSDFGTVSSGSVVTNWMAVTNNGLGLLTISGLTTNGDGAARFSIDGIPATLAEGAQGAFSVVFEASAVGAHTAAVQVVSDGPSPYIVYLSGTAAKGDQTITFPPIGDRVTTSKVGLAATASSGLSVSFTTNDGSAVIADGTNLSFTGAGSVSIVASQAGNGSWNPAPDVTNTFNVTKAQAGVYLAGLAQTYDGMARSVTATSDPSGLTVAFTYDGNVWAPTNAGSYAVTGTVNDANWQGSADGTLVVSRANQVLSNFLPLNGGVFLATDAAGLSASASSGLSVSFAVNSGPGLITGLTNLSFTTTGEVSVVASQSGDGNWNPAPEQTNIYTVIDFAEVSIASAHGTTIPVTGVYTMLVGTVFTNQAQTPDTQGTTQYVCAGWAMSGNEPASGSGTQVVMTVTNDAVLTWRWTTNYWLETTAGDHGRVVGGNVWVGLGVTTQLTAVADAYYHFTNWTGSVESSVNPLTVLMDAPKTLMAHFAAVWTTNQPTPEWWMAQYGLTNFEADVLLDADGDGVPTGNEWVMNTDPTNGLSVLHAARYEVAYGTNCFEVVSTNTESPYEVYTQIVCDVIGQMLAWPCATDRVYDVEADLLLPGTWTSVPGLTNLVPASGWLVVTNALDGAALKLHRVKVRLP
jgi:hypothetical protein